MSFNLAHSIESLAPTLATMLGGPMAGTAVTALEGALGLSPGAGKDEVAKVLSSGSLTPEQAVAIRKVDAEHAEKMKQLDINLTQVNADHEAAMAATDEKDRESARGRQVALKDQTPAHLAFVIIGGFMSASVALVYFIVQHPAEVGQIPNSAWLLIGSLYGYLANEAKAAASYYFGSSTGSKGKDDTISALSKQG